MKLTTIISQLKLCIGSGYTKDITYIGATYSKSTGIQYGFKIKGAGEFRLQYAEELDSVIAHFGDYCEVITNVDDVLDLI